MGYDWDGWREAYDETSFDEQKRVYEELSQLHPEQAHYNLEDAGEAFLEVETVVELGGWRGDLALVLLSENETLTSWVNYDLCHWALNDGNKCEDSRYEGVELFSWPWEVDLPSADLFISTHTIEHMKFAQFVRLSEQFVKYGKVHLQSPLPMSEDPDWSNYGGTHILEKSWDSVNARLEELGFTSSDESQNRTYIRV